MGLSRASASFDRPSRAFWSAVQPAFPVARRPFAEQCRFIDAAIESQPLAPLLEALAAQPDPAPLAHAVDRLLERLAEASAGGYGSGAAITDAIAAVLPGLPDAHLGRVLRGLPDDADGSNGQPGARATVRAVLADAVAQALDALPPSRIAAACFLIRWLRREAPDRWQALEVAAIARAATLAPESLDDATLLRVPGSHYRALADAAAQAGRGSAWHLRLAAFAAQVLDTLEKTPKSLSQVGAEELLSRRVYTDPAHFIMELLQNAEDARARQITLAVSADALVVDHDGAPFDARDVVGVLSIGQTTKLGDRIGTFGVGFKSVYAISDRPRLHSGPFDFEIADVSIPRRLDERPAGLGEGCTRLVLPLRTPDDALAGAGAIGARALEVPALTLLALRSIERIAGVSSVGGAVVRRVVRREARPVVGAGWGEDAVDGEGQGAGGTTRLIDGDRVLDLWIETDRDAAGASLDPVEASVLVAIALDAAGRPTPLPAAMPTVYCFLPTHERPGLRFAVHARFALPVDRERIDATAPASQRAMQHAGRLLGRRLARGVHVEALLAVLPRPDELATGWGGLFTGLFQAVVAVAVIPTVSGERVVPGAVRLVADERLAAVLATVPLAGGRAVRFADARAAAMVRALGGRDLDAVMLLDAVERADSQARWLVEGIAPVLRALAAGLERLDPMRLAPLPLLPDETGHLHAAAAVSRAPAALRRFFAGHRVLVEATLAADPALAVLWRALGVPLLDADAVIADLRDPARAEVMRDAIGAEALLEWLADQPPPRVAGLGAVRLVPDASGEVRPAAGEGSGWLTGAGPLGEWARRHALGPPRVADAIERRFGALLRRLGAATFGLDAIMDAIDAIDDDINRTALLEVFADLHRALDAIAAELPAGQCHRLAALPIFADVHGMLRPLHGSEPAVLPADAELARLIPAAPWLDPALAARRHLPLMSPITLGALDVARGLCDPEAPLYTPPSHARWPQAVGWLVANPLSVPSALAERLASAPIWLASDGRRYAIAALRRRPEVAALAALWAAWDRPEAAAETVALAAALGIALPTAEGARLVADLVALAETAGAMGAGGEIPNSAVAAAPIPPALLDALPAALAALAATTPASLLAPLAEAPLHRATDGRLCPLGDWRAPDLGGAHRADEPLRAALAGGARRLLEAHWQATITPLLDALGIAAADARALVVAIERDPSLAEGDRRDRARHALAQRLAPLGPADAPRLSALPLWPTRAGTHAAAVDVVGPGQLDRWPALVEAALPAARRLAASAEDDARRLAGPFRFALAADVVVARLSAEARPGEALEAQPAWIGSVAAVRAVLAGLRAAGVDAAGLPLAVSADRRLVVGPLWVASDDGRLLAAATALADRLADAEWARDEPLARPLPARQLLAAISALGREPGPAASHALLADGAARAALYRWLEERADEIGGDAQALGLLGQAPVMLTTMGTLQPPRALVPDGALVGLPDLGLDWTPAAEVPEALRMRLRGWFRLDARALRVVVERLIAAHRAVAAAGDVTRSAALVECLARLGAGDEVEFAARFRLHRELKVAGEDGVFVRPKALALPLDPGHRALIASFHPAPPPGPHPAYAAVCAPLLRAAGASGDLDLAGLVAVVEAAVGLDAALARARYVVDRAVAMPSLFAALDLDRRRWLPDAQGALASPSELYWPDAALDALIGADAGRRLHPALWHTLPEAARRLAFRGVEGVDPAEVAAGLVEGQAVSGAVLRWFDAGLLAGRLSAETVRGLLGGRRVFADDDGRCRTPAGLVRELPAGWLGRRRGGFGEGRAVPRLLGALGIAAEPGAGVVRRWLVELGDDLRRGVDLLAQEPELAGAVPRSMAVLVGSRERPAVLAAVDGGGVLRLVLGDDARLAGEGAGEGAGNGGDRWWPVGDVEPALWAETLRGWRLASEASIASDASMASDMPSESSMASVAAMASEASARSKPLMPSRAERRRRAHLASEPDPAAEPAAVADAETADDANADAATTDAPAPPPPDDDRLLDRLRRWWRGDEPPAPPRPPPDRRPPPPPPPPARAPRPEPREDDDSVPFAPPDRTRWFRPSQSVDAQLHANPTWLAARQHAPDVGFGFTPRALPAPHLYGPALIADRFDARSQRWTAAQIDPRWTAPPPGGGYRINFAGRLPTGEAALAVPLYSRVVSIDAPGVRRVEGRDGRPVLFTGSPTEVRYTVELGEAPRFGEVDPPSIAALLAPTAPDRLLPPECHDLIDALALAPPLARVAGIVGFIRANYRYDPRYLEDPAHARHLRRATRGSANVHLAALHADADARHLGAGVCYELNALACELLRRVGIPAAIATGWTFDRGQVDEPDHMWAMALLTAADGPRWLPVDASTTIDGRPLHVGSRPASPWQPRAPKQDRPPPVSMALPKPRGEVAAIPLRDLVRVVRHLEAIGAVTARDDAALRAAARRLLTDPEQARALLAAIDDE